MVAKNTIGSTQRFCLHNMLRHLESVYRFQKRCQIPFPIPFSGAQTLVSSCFGINGRKANLVLPDLCAVAN